MNCTAPNHCNVIKIVMVTIKKKEKYNMGTGEMAQVVKALLYQHEDQRSGLQKPMQMTGGHAACL